MFSTLENCTQNADKGEWEDDEDSENDIMIRKLVEELNDRYILRNEESMLATDTNTFEDIIVCSHITQIIGGVCDLIQPVAESQPEPTGDL